MRDWLLAQPAAEEFIARLSSLLELVAACDEDVRVGIGCSGGRHRSRIVAEEVRARLEYAGVATRVMHREQVAA